MKKILIGLLLFVSWSPYLFFATSIEEVKDYHRSYNCIMQNEGTISKFVVLTDVFYSPLDKKIVDSNGGRMILPVFLYKGNLMSAHCGKYEFSMGRSDWAKPGDKISLDTKKLVLKFFGYTVEEDETFEGASNQWRPGEKEGEVVSTVLINDKEVKMFEGKIISK